MSIVCVMGDALYTLIWACSSVLILDFVKDFRGRNIFIIIFSDTFLVTLIIIMFGIGK